MKEDAIFISYTGAERFAQRLKGLSGVPTPRILEHRVKGAHMGYKLRIGKLMVTDTIVDKAMKEANHAY